jgi:hypothetical protein
VTISSTMVKPNRFLACIFIGLSFACVYFKSAH